MTSLFQDTTQRSRQRQARGEAAGERPQLTQSARQTMLFAQRNPNCSIVEAGEPAQDASQVEAVSAFQISDMY